MKKAFAVLIHNYDEPIECIGFYFNEADANSYAEENVSDGNARAAWVQTVYISDDAKTFT